MLIRISMLLCYALLLLLINPGRAEHLITQEETLAGLKGVGVEIAAEDPTRNILQPMIESRLRRLGIAVLTKEEVAQTPGNPRLRVICVLFNKPRLYVSVQLIQTVTLHNGNTYGAATWERIFNSVADDPYITTAKQQVSQTIDEFCLDFIAANAKQRADDTMAPAEPQTAARSEEAAPEG